MSKGLCAGQVALVTGASQGGTGTAIAIRPAAEGAKANLAERGWPDPYTYRPRGLPTPLRWTHRND